jgi:MerR family transcriptional regulator, heat shock protein HspR
MTMNSPYDMSDDMPVYVISVAASLSGMHPQTLRGYERVGLVTPRRSAGGGRRYSMRDILALREIQRLSQEEGINLSGIKRILDLEREVEHARLLAAQLHGEVAQLRAELESTRAVAARLARLRRSQADPRATLVPVRTTSAATRVTIWRAPQAAGPASGHAAEGAPQAASNPAVGQGPGHAWDIPESRPGEK